MDRVSLALLSAVYDRPEVNLYHEVYFPIIRYTLVRRFRDFSNPGGYSVASIYGSRRSSGKVSILSMRRCCNV